MQNPFLRLKHYRTDHKDNDSRENHATEVLAACLVLSHHLRADFLSFLFEGEKVFTAEEANEFVVETQTQTDDGGWIDLLLEQPGAFSIVVEVKVGSSERGDQIQAYRKWLDRTRTTKPNDNHVFSLVQRPNPAFQIQTHGGKARRTWQQFYARFQRRKADYADAAESKLIEHLCDYLEAEAIVSTWNPKDLLAYSVGLKAHHAMEAVFKQVEARLLDLDENYETKIVVKSDPWSRLEIGRKSWKTIFGNVGYLNKLYMFFPTRDMGNSADDQFYFELQLWSKWHRCDWNLAKKKLPLWIQFLRGEGFEEWVNLKPNKTLEIDSLSYTFNDPPADIKACYDDESLAYVTAEEIVALSDTALVDRLVERIISHCEVVSRFG